MHTVSATLESFVGVRDALAKKFGDAISSKLAWVAKTTAQVGAADAEKLSNFVDASKTTTMCSDVFTNAEISDSESEKLRA